jgi:hypothetical protein
MQSSQRNDQRVQRTCVHVSEEYGATALWVRVRKHHLCLSNTFRYIGLTDLARVPEAGVCCDDQWTCVAAICYICTVLACTSTLSILFLLLCVEDVPSDIALLGDAFRNILQTFCSA